MTWAGIVAGQIGAAVASRTTLAPLWEIGLFSNRPLLRGIAFELCFAAAIVYLPPLQSLFQTAALGLPELALLSLFPFLVWGSDELRRRSLRRSARRPESPPSPALSRQPS